MGSTIKRQEIQRQATLRTLPSELVTPLDVDPESLRRLGWKSAHLSSEISANALAQMMDQLQKEDLGHCWKNFHYQNRENILQELQAYEDQRRPTLILGYFGVTLKNELVLYGAGVIAEKISHSFPHEGFPVVARCYIAPEFRDFRLYAPAVLARVRICTQYWEKRLKAIHLGSTNPRVQHAVRSHYFPLPFTYIGNEKLCVPGEKIARDYLQFSLSFRNRLLRETHAIGPQSASVKALMNQIEKLLQNQFQSNDYHLLLQLIENVRQEVKRDPLLDASALSELMDFFKAVPVINDPAVETEAEIPVIAPRAA